MKTKTFDCIKMKEECQQAVLKKYGGLPPDERERQMEADILADPILGDFYRRVTTKPGAHVAEGGAGYVAASDAEKGETE